jgi:nucleotide-binding universal stress UspA family protein
MFDIKRILVPVDFGDCSQRALDLALELGEKHNASVEVVHVAMSPPYMSPSISAALGPVRLQELEELGRREAEQQLDGMLARTAKPAGVGITSKIVFGIPQEVILACAGASDLLVMGTHGRRGLSRMFLGSVTEKVVRECTTPVLVVHANEPRS